MPSLGQLFPQMAWVLSGSALSASHLPDGLVGYQWPVGITPFDGLIIAHRLDPVKPFRKTFFSGVLPP